MKALIRKPRLIRERGIVKGLRPGRGFSKLEISEVGLTIKEALRLGIPVDLRRRSKHDWNILALREFLRSLSK